MNHCTLAVEVVSQPQLRHTQDGLAIAELEVQFPGVGKDAAPCAMPAVRMGDKAKDLVERVKVGDRLILEGSIRIDSITKGETRTKRAQLRISRVHPLQIGTPQRAIAFPPTPTPEPAPPGIIPEITSTFDEEIPF